MQGRAWRWLIPAHLVQGKASIIFLEILAAIITITISISHDNHTTTYPHVLSFLDNSSALGWMHHSRFDPVNNPQHNDLARDLASFLFHHKAMLSSQHVPGESNVTADCLSCDFHLIDTDILSLLKKNKAPASQIPTNLHIQPPSKALFSQASSLLELLLQGKGSRLRPKPSSLAHSSTTKFHRMKWTV